MACDYAVCPAILNEILDKLEVVPEREAFANKDYKRFDKWYGEGSPDEERAIVGVIWSWKQVGSCM